LKYKPDKELEMKILKMKVLRDQTYQDLSKLVERKQNGNWRNWDKQKSVYGYDRFDINKLKNQIKQEIKVLTKIEKIDDKQNDDLNFLIRINHEMTDYVVAKMGGAGWLKLWQASKLRQQ
jgi:hypothetical protein